MCVDPFSLLSLGVGAASSVAGGVIQYQGSKAQEEYQKRAAMMAEQKAALDERLLRRRHDQQLAQMRGQYLSGGLALEGSVSDVLLDSATNASLDEQAVRYGGQVEADNLRFGAAISKANAGSAMFGGVMGALATGINTFTDARRQQQNRTMITNPYVRGAATGLY